MMTQVVRFVIIANFSMSVKSGHVIVFHEAENVYVVGMIFIFYRATE